MKRQIVAALVAVLFAWAPAHAQSEKPVVIKGGHQQVIPSGDTLDLSANPLNTNITGAAIQCVQASTTGVLSGTGASCGGGGGGGTVTTTGTPALGNLTKFSGATSITNGDLSGDCTTSGSLATICLKTNGVSFGTFATQNYATPPAIGATTPAAGSFTTLSASGNLTTNVTGSTQCLHASSLGVVSGTGSDCGSGSGGGGGLWSGLFSATPTQTSTGLSNTLSGSPAVTTTNSAAGVHFQASTPNSAIAVYTTSVPATPYSFTVLMTGIANGSGASVGWTDGTKMQVIYTDPNPAGTLTGRIDVQSNTNFSTFSATNASLGVGLWAPVWLKVRDDGTTVYFQFAYDGVNFYPLYSVAKSSGFLGASGYSHVVVSGAFITVLSWTQGT